MQFFKRLEIHGFKSFGNKTVIDFHPGITVIVGPNGCGKSNVFDSIRWALGEQSAKSMRGSRMGDVIFNGSGSMKALGMSKVTLTLNNRLRTLPLDYDEVEISRRLFRTGESEYVLNKNQCRLKDITGQFLDTGIGTDSYSVLEQGKVDAIINSKPLERRAIFDEAAGISKYKARKHEAILKLNRTDDDLLRLTDIINEVRRQAGGLKRQASKAERYKQLTAELRVLEMELLVRRYFLFRTSTKESEAHFEKLSATVKALRDELKQIEEEQLAYRSKADDVQQSLDDNQALNFELNKDLNETQNQIALLVQRRENNRERRASLDAQIAEYLENAAKLEAVEAETSAELDKQQADVENLTSQQKEKQAIFESLKGDSDANAETMTRLRQEITQATRARMEKDNEIRVARVMEEKLVDELGQSDAELETLQAQHDELSRDLTQRRDTMDFAERERERLTGESASARESFRTRELELYNITGDMENARRQAQECQSRHDALSDLQASFEGYFRGVKEVMTAGQKGKLRGLVGVVTTLIEAKREHEVAIEVALGGQAQDIVVNTAEDGKAAIRWLKETRVGRATFLPLDLVEGRENSHNLRQVIGQKGVIGFATELVKFDPKLSSVVQHLLGNVIVVENLDVAVELEKRGIRTRYVTLDGEMVAASGAMTGGNMKVAGLLNRTREVKELADRLKQLRASEKNLAEKVTALKTEVSQLKEKSERLVREAQAQEVEAARARKDFEAIDHRAAEKSQQLARVDQRRASMEREISDHRMKQQEGSGLLTELAGKVDDLELQLLQVEEGASARQQEVAEAARQANELMIALTAGNERARSLRERMVNSRGESNRLKEAAENRRNEIRNLEEGELGAEADLVKLEEQMVAYRRQKEELESQITFENQQKEVVHLDLRKLGERSQILQRDYNESQNELHEVELKRQEFLLQLDNIRMQAREKFLLDLNDVIARVLMPETVVEVEAPVTVAKASNAEQGGDSEGEATEMLAAGEEEPDGQLEAELSPAMDIVDLPEEARERLENLRTPDVIAGLVQQIRASVDALGPVHVGAIDEYNELNERLEFLVNQEKDLNEAKGMLAETISKIDETTQDLFTKAFGEIRTNFEQTYRRLFGGGRADLILTEENGVLESGIDIVAQPPGKKPQHISLLSGGEKALTAVALLFAIFMRKPSPFCILDEIDAPLDDKNVERFKELVKEFAHTTQFIIITHNKQTMHLGNTIYGITMEEQGVSRAVSIRLDELEDTDMVKEMELEPVG